MTEADCHFTASFFEERTSATKAKIPTRSSDGPIQERDPTENN